MDSGGGGSGGLTPTGTDWAALATAMKNFGGGLSGMGGTTDESKWLKLGGQGPGPYQAGGQGLSNLLATLMQMHQQAYLANQATNPPAGTTSLLR